jgi:hypothetical protein
MPVKPINQLPARTPALADVLAVADPFNGQTGKSTVSQLTSTTHLLTSKSPAYTDVIAVADPTTGAAGKASVVGVVSAGVDSSAVVTTTTSFQNVQLSSPVFTLGTPRSVQMGGTVYGSNERWIDSLIYIDRWTESLAINGVYGISNFFSVNATNRYLQTITSTSLKFIFSTISYATSNSLTTFSMPSLIYLNSLSITSSGLTTLNCPELVYAGNLAISASSLTSFNFPNLKYIITLSSTLSSATSVNFSSLEVVDSSFSLNAPLVASAEFPELTGFGLSVTSGTAIGTFFGSALTYLRFPKLKKIGGQATSKNLTFSNPFGQSTVDHVLVVLAAMDGTNGTMILSTWTININGVGASAPSATGLAAKATLVARGCTVTHN